MGQGTHGVWTVPLTNKDNVKSASRGGVLKLRKGRSATLKRLTAKLQRQNASLVKTRPGEIVTLKHLAENLSKSPELSKKQAEAMLGDLVNLVTKHLKKGARIRLGDLGVLVVRKGSRRQGAPNLLTEEPVENAYTPSARALALLRGKEISEKDLKESGGAFTLKDVETLLGISRQAIDKKVQDDALLAVPGPHGRRRYPAVQFTKDGTVPGLRHVLKSLPSTNSWFRLNFLVTPDSHLAGRRPIDVLSEGNVESVLTAAKAVGVQGA
jgi:nucleoid DNA-binding protein